jgi:hypothetical protein
MQGGRYGIQIVVEQVGIDIKPAGGCFTRFARGAGMGWTIPARLL